MAEHSEPVRKALHALDDAVYENSWLLGRDYEDEKEQGVSYV